MYFLISNQPFFRATVKRHGTTQKLLYFPFLCISLVNYVLVKTQRTTTDKPLCMEIMDIPSYVHMTPQGQSGLWEYSRSIHGKEKSFYLKTDLGGVIRLISVITNNYVSKQS